MKFRTAFALAFAAVTLAASSARAELVFFQNGRVMSVQDHHIEGDQIVLVPRGGGEISFNASIVARIEPDEVPYPEPQREAPELKLQPTEVAASPAFPDTFDPIIDRVSAEQGVDARLVHAVIQVESNYRERARSPKGAMGLMQLMPATAREYAVRNPYDPASNIEGGIKYLKSLLDRFPLQLALAAYNAGASAVERFRGVPPYPETRDYVSRILQLVSH
jgi:soluble lytic murein transglycosylase-like protein